jgi:hypothetical protein
MHLLHHITACTIAQGLICWAFVGVEDTECVPSGDFLEVKASTG